MYSLILKTADAYENARSSTNNNGAVHARFLRILVENDRHRFGQRDGGVQIDPRLQGMERMFCLTVDLFLLRVPGYSLSVILMRFHQAKSMRTALRKTRRPNRIRQVQLAEKFIMPQHPMRNKCTSSLLLPSNINHSILGLEVATTTDSNHWTCQRGMVQSAIIMASTE